MTGARQMTSVGIDVGTTTTQLVVSRLVVRNTARPGLVPRIEVASKQVEYRSPIHLTPLRSPDEVDAEALAGLVAGEYRAAGVDAATVETGAVIVTGEISRAKNADAILYALAAMAGDFVVTVAGPNLEAQIAGRGSGAAAYSAAHFTQVTNADIGGGTSNAAVFKLADHLGSSAMAVGGRQVQLDTDGVVQHIAPGGRAIVEALGLPLREGQRTDLGTLRRLCDAMADLIADLIEGRTTPLGERLQLSPPLRHADRSSVVFLSGGVGQCYYEDCPAATMAEVAVYGDVGPLLAEALRDNARMQGLTVLQPAETMRATVLGAASQTVTLSGSTIWAEPAHLPLRNLPVVRPAGVDQAPDPEQLADAIRVAVQRWDADGDGRVAIALDLPPNLDYAYLTDVAGGVTRYAGDVLPLGEPLVVVTQRDYAQALGQTIKTLRPDEPLIVIDQVGLGEGDFIDIGSPILDGRCVPLSVKTLVFYS
jgi:ethanolamine utilization protein EutA